MFRIQSLVRGALFAGALALLSLPMVAQAHHGGCFPVTHCQPCYTPVYTPCYTPCYRPLIYTQPLFVQPCVRPIIVTPYVQPCLPYAGGCRVIVH